jgi:hypothetical protein
MNRVWQGLHRGLLKVFCCMIFFILFVPIGITLRVMKMNRLIHPDKTKLSYWTSRA